VCAFGPAAILVDGEARDLEWRKQPMDSDAVRERARAFSDALAAGDIDRATEDFSNELRRNLGEVISLLPLPVTEASVESVEHGGAGYNVVVRLVGETDEVLLQTRWKERDGRPTIVEASHESKTPRALETTEDGEEPAGDDAT
jgi:hypothetical protein